MCVCVCYRLRLFISGEEQMALWMFLCLARKGFQCDIHLGTPGHKRDRFLGVAGRGPARAIAKGEGAPTSYIIVDMGDIPSVEREILSLSGLKQASSERGPASAVSKEGIL